MDREDSCCQRSRSTGGAGEEGGAGVCRGGLLINE